MQMCNQRGLQMKGIPFLKKDIGKISAIIDSIDMLSDNSYT